MEEKILKRLEFYEDYNILVDYNFVEYVLSVLRKHYHVQDCLKTFMVYRKKGSTGGMFIHSRNKIIINLSAYDHIKSVKMNNILMLSMILHEFEHVIQKKVVFEFSDLSNSDSYLYDLLYLSYENYNNAVSDFHDYIPIERLANIKSFYKLIKILSLDKDRYKKEIARLKVILSKYIINGYKKDDNSECSLKYFIDAINENKEDKKYYYTYLLMQEDAKLPFSKKLLYGLPINSNEYNLVLVNKKRNIKLLSKCK